MQVRGKAGTVLARLGVVGRFSPSLVVCGVLLGGCAAEPQPRAEEARAPARGLAASSEPHATGSGEANSALDLGLPGFLVWESNRSGAWRLWTRDLEGSAPRRLTGDEPGRRHCCPHVSPDGAWIAYLSLPDGKPEYSPGDASGPLRLIRPDGSEEREVAPAARTYFEHRAAVWRSPNELIYIDGSGRTALLEVATGRLALLTTEPVAEYGSLIDSRLAWGTDGRAEFSIYREDAKRLVERFDHRGCQPYFSHDGRWGFWTAGVGGPLNRLELATGRVSTILDKSDHRMPAGLGYLYFPMLSRDGSLLAFAASRDQHDHFKSDYEIFVAEADPETLELTADPVRMTDHPATDRFPDVYPEPLPLGRQTGEAPLTAAWRAPGPGDWQWRFGDGAGARGPSAAHRFTEPGRYEVTATRGATTLRGRVTVLAARPPRALDAGSREEGRRVEVGFDEPVAADSPALRFESGAAIRDWSLSADGRSLTIELAEPLAGADTLHLAGFVDRAERPNPMAPSALSIDPPLWPSDRDGLAFLWANGAAPNLVFDPALGVERASTVEPHGRSVLDHHFAMVLGRGTFTASGDDMDHVLRAIRGANRMSLEAWATPGAAGRLIALGGRPVNFALEAEAGRLRLTLRTGHRGPEAFESAEIAAYEPGRPLHLAFTYTPGRLAAYVDGAAAGEWPLAGDFFPWQRQPLVFGEGVTAAPGTTPKLEGVAIYSRILPPAEVRENFLRYRAALARRPAVPQAVVEAELLRRSRTPSLEEISPYREALAVHEWQVTKVVAGDHPGGPVRVAHWAILDGEPEPVAAPGARRRLTIERFELNPQLEGAFVADDLGPGGGTLYYTLE